MSTSKKSELSMRLLKANRDQKDGVIDQIELSHRVKAINEEGKTHGMSPNEILSDAQQNSERFNQTITKTRQLSEKYWKAVNDEKLGVINAYEKTTALREISEEVKMYNLSIDAVTAPLVMKNEKDNYYPIN